MKSNSLRNGVAVAREPVKRDSVKSGSSGATSSESESGLDSSDSNNSHSDDDQQLLSTPTAAQIDVK